MSHSTHMNEACLTYEWVMSHIWMSHVTRMNESFHTHEWVHVPNVLWCVAVNCSELQWIAVSCSELQWVAVCCRVWLAETRLSCYIWMNNVTHMNAFMCCSVLQCVAVCCSVLQCVAACGSVLQSVAGTCQSCQTCKWTNKLPCVAVYCSVLQCVAVCCSVLVMSRMWISHVKCMNESYHINEGFCHIHWWVMSDTWRIHFAEMKESCQRHTPSLRETPQSHLWGLWGRDLWHSASLFKEECLRECL